MKILTTTGTVLLYVVLLAVCALALIPIIMWLAAR